MDKSTTAEGCRISEGGDVLVSKKVVENNACLLGVIDLAVDGRENYKREDRLN